MDKRTGLGAGWVVACVTLFGCAEQKVTSSGDSATPAVSPATVTSALSPGAVKGDATAVALSRALDDEYKARATYRATIARLGEVRPFVNIVEAEERHIEALLAVHKSLELTPPEDRWAGKVTSEETLRAACSLAVQAELDNEALYEELLGQVGSADIRGVMKRLQSASRDRHLPAFRRCLERPGRRRP